MTDHLARTFMTVVTTDDHPGLRLALELNRRPPAEPEASPTRGGKRLRNQESWSGKWTAQRSGTRPTNQHDSWLRSLLPPRVGDARPSAARPVRRPGLAASAR